MSQDRSSLGEFEIRGEWWLPEKPSNRVAGVLSYEAGQFVNLELDSPLMNHWVEGPPGTERYSFTPIPSEVVVGTGRDGTRCTLVDAMSRGTTFTAACLLLGQHFERKADIKFSSVDLMLTHLEEWSEHSPFGFWPPLVGPTEGEAEKPYKVELGYRRKKLLEFDVPSGGFRIEIYSGINASLHIYKSLTLEHRTFVFVEPQSPQDLSWYRRFFLDCTRLFSFLVGLPVYRTSTVFSQAPVGEGVEVPNDVQFYEERQSPALAEDPHPIKMPLPFEFLQPVAQLVFDRWFSTAAKLGPVHQLLIETLPPSDMGLETVLLRLAQGIEVFYRRSVNETYVEAEKYEQYREAMVNSFPEDMPAGLKSRLRNYLKYGNEYSLKNIVKHLIESLDEPTRKALRIENPSQFAQLVANTRNSLTHHTTPGGPVASTAREYHDLNQRLRALLYGVLAHSLGFDGLALVNCVQNVLTYA